MRIIGGQLRGRIIPVPKTFKGRPTTDFAREGLFNMLRSSLDFNGMEVLELFAGTGAFSLECLSRGASECLAVDIQASHVKAINENFELFGFTNSTAEKADVLKWLGKSNGQFDLIFADPPFDLNTLTFLPDAILNADLLRSSGVLIVEHPKEIRFEDHQKFDRTRAFGNVHFSFFRP